MSIHLEAGGVFYLMPENIGSSCANHILTKSLIIDRPYGEVQRLLAERAGENGPFYIGQMCVRMQRFARHFFVDTHYASEPKMFNNPFLFCESCAHHVELHIDYFRDGRAGVLLCLFEKERFHIDVGPPSLITRCGKCDG